MIDLNVPPPTDFAKSCAHGSSFSPAVFVRHPFLFAKPRLWTNSFSASSTSSGPVRRSTGSWRQPRRSICGGRLSRSPSVLIAWRGGAEGEMDARHPRPAVGGGRNGRSSNPLKHAVHRLRPWQAMAGVRQVDLARQASGRGCWRCSQPVAVAVTDGTGGG